MKNYTTTEKARGELAIRALSDRAKKAYRENEPLDVYEVERDGSTVYDVRGAIDADGLTLSELETELEELETELEAQIIAEEAELDVEYIRRNHQREGRGQTLVEYTAEILAHYYDDAPAVLKRAAEKIIYGC